MLEIGMKTTAYPSHVVDTPTGFALVASETLEEAAIVERMEGRVVSYSRIPESELRNVFEIDDDRWMVPQSPARYINHSCDPNCYVSSNLDVITTRRVYKGEELTIMYNEVTLDKYMRSGSVLPKWDARRSFECMCGAPKCIGAIDRYVIPVPQDPNSKSVRMDVVERHGRGMFAGRSFLKGELIERAPVIVINDKQWPSAEKTILSDYAFDWGEKDEHAAIALGYISIYNHSYSPNAQLEQMLDELMMEIIAIKDIQRGEEITINYNGDPANQDPLWFTQRAAKRRSSRKKSTRKFAYR
jgi:SET domain-containing protein